MKNKNAGSSVLVGWAQGLPTPDWIAGHYRRVLFTQNEHCLYLIGEQPEGEFVTEVHRKNGDGTYALLHQQDGFKSLDGAKNNFDFTP